MSAAEERLYGLMEIAERQQAAAQAALEGLAAERAALARERRALARDVEALQSGTQAAVRGAVADSFAGAATDGAAAVRTATQPLLGQLEQVTQQAGAAQAALRRVVLWASWRLLGWLVAVGAVTVMLGWLMSSGVLWWDAGSIKDAQQEKARLQGEIAQMQDTYDTLKSAGALGRVIRCNPGNRLCIQVNEEAGSFGTEGHYDYRVIQGY